MPINITRCTNNCGSIQFAEKLIPLMITNAMNYKAQMVYGDDMQIINWIYVKIIAKYNEH